LYFGNSKLETETGGRPLKTVRKQEAKRKEAGHYSGLFQHTLKFFADSLRQQQGENNPTHFFVMSPLLGTNGKGRPFAGR